MEPSDSSPVPKAPAPDLNTINALLQQQQHHHRFQSQMHACSLQRISGHAHELAVVALDDGSRAWLRFPPASSSRMLRQEDTTLHTDIDVIHLLAQTKPALTARIVKEDLPGLHYGKPCILTSDLPGVLLSTIADSVSVSERKRIDHAIGEWLSNIAPLFMPSFGIAQQLRARHGQRSWKRVFGQLMQGVLMDAEDAFINVPYNRVMKLMYDKGYVFDEVRSANLTMFDAGEERKVLVDPTTKSVTGILGLSNSAWGDPLAARCFIWPDNKDALSGFGISTVSETLQTRILFYTVYHCLVAIVRDIFRPLEEMRMPDARRRLLSALAELDSS